MKIVHAADLHIDSPMRGLERYDGAPVDRMRGATRRALEHLVELCIGEEAGLLLLAGDIYDGDWKDYSTGLFFARQMSQLREAGVRVVSIRGNHDAASQITRHLTLPENVRELSTRRAESAVYEDLGVAVHGRGFAKRAVTEDLAASYPAPVPGLLNVGLLHTCLNGREGHEPYAPCHLEALLAHGYDYWALGHVHRQEVLAEAPWVAFSGNLQGRHFRETGPKGALLLHVEAGRVTRVEPRALDAVRWCAVSVDVSFATSALDAVDLARDSLEAEAAAADRPLAARVTLTGASAAHDMLVDDPERWENALRSAAGDAAVVWIERMIVGTTSELDMGELAAQEDAVGQVVRAFTELQEGGADQDELFLELAELHRKLPPEVRAELRFDDPEDRRAILADASRLLLSRLTGRTEETEP